MGTPIQRKRADSLTANVAEAAGSGDPLHAKAKTPGCHQVLTDSVTIHSDTKASKQGSTVLRIERDISRCHERVWD